MVTTLLTASRVNVLFANKRSSYIPDGTEAGTKRLLLPLAAPVVKAQATKLPSGALRGTSANQSVDVGAAMPSQFTMSVLLAVAVAGVTRTTAPETTVTPLLEARRVSVLLAKRRSSYVPTARPMDNKTVVLPLDWPFVNVCVR